MSDPIRFPENKIWVIDMLKMLGQWGFIFYAKHFLIPDIHWDKGIYIWQYVAPFLCVAIFSYFPAKTESWS